MKKVLIVLTEEEVFQLQRILIDKEEKEALDYLDNVINPKIKKETNCLKM